MEHEFARKTKKLRISFVFFLHCFFFFVLFNLNTYIVKSKEKLFHIAKVCSSRMLLLLLNCGSEENKT